MKLIIRVLLVLIALWVGLFTQLLLRDAEMGPIVRYIINIVLELLLCSSLISLLYVAMWADGDYKDRRACIFVILTVFVSCIGFGFILDK